jgi:hypothetical protein
LLALPTTAVSADKGYDSDESGQNHRSQRDAIANIPPRSNRIDQRPVDWHRYKARHLGRMFLQSAQAVPSHRHALRQTVQPFQCFLHLACAYIWLL